VNSNPPPGGNGSGVPRGPTGRGRPGPSAVPPPPSDRPAVPPRSPRVALEPERVPLPKRRSKRVRHPLVIAGNAIFMVLVLVSVTVGAALYFGKQRFEAPGPLTEDRVVNIPRGLGIRDIAALLEREGVIDQPYVFVGGVMVMKARGGLKHGEYKFTRHASLADVVDTIIEGKVVQHALTVPEGLTSEQIVARLLEDKALSGQIKEIPPEGSLLPETYKFTRGMTRAQIIKRMQEAQQHLVKFIWAHRVADLPLKSPEDLIILASIVEKETGKTDERSRVAAVFINRLKKQMRLQSDPTIIYGLTGGKGSLGRPIKKSEIEQATPYNTYVISGLPPGPIANPGKASLEAVANPARTKDLYFVADGSGGHVFSETYEQHQKNVAHLRAIEHAKAQVQEIKPAAPASADKKDGVKP
jgi:peptidoglycan lytic transglycosylase G